MDGINQKFKTKGKAINVWTLFTDKKAGGLMKKLLAVLLCLGLAGCATTAGYEAILNTWTGSNINSLISSWGYPASSFTAPDGNTVYVYQSGGQYTMPTQTTYTGQVSPWGSYSASSITTGGQTLNFWCKTYFEVNQDKIIVTWRWEGNSCRAVAPKQQTTNTTVLNETEPTKKDNFEGELIYSGKNAEFSKSVKMSLMKVFDSDPRSKEFHTLVIESKTENDKTKKAVLEDKYTKISKAIHSDIMKAVADYAEKNKIYFVSSAESCSDWCKQHEDDISDSIILILNKQTLKVDGEVTIQSDGGYGLEDKIKTISKLLADGLITKSEFDARKKALLDKYTNVKN